MCKTYDAIFEIRKNVSSDVLVVYVDHLEIKGTLACGDEDQHKCQQDIVTLKDVNVTCKKSDETKEFKMLNIPTMWIKAFCFECCLK